MQELQQISKIHYADSQYPSLLREISSPPKQLHVAGQLTDIPLVAVVGSRRPTRYGKEITYTLVSELAAAGIGIVSGLAIGIDAHAHEAALMAGGYTLAVLGSGLDYIYPPRNRPLGFKILEAGGAIVSEYPSEMPPLKQNFPARNRIIAGLSLAVVVTEADEASGSLITASFGLDFNREVMAVPGSIASRRSIGPHNLIRRGATLVTNAREVLQALDLTSTAIAKPPPGPKNAQEAEILRLMSEGIRTSQELIEHTGMAAADFAQAISVMELSGKIANLGSGVWIPR